MSSPPQPSPPSAEFASAFDEALRSIRPDLAAATVTSLRLHAWRVTERNRSVNLTRITEPRDMARKHVGDSLAPLDYDGLVKHGARLLDIGTGPGWPGLALAIARPDLAVTLLDSTRKKTDLLREIVDELGLGDRVEVAWARLEAPEFRSRLDRIDIATARAVGPIRKILGWLPATYSGDVLLWKGPAGREELHDARGQLARLNLRKAAFHEYEIAGDPAERVLIQLAPRGA